MCGNDQDANYPLSMSFFISFYGDLKAKLAIRESKQSIKLRGTLRRMKALPSNFKIDYSQCKKYLLVFPTFHSILNIIYAKLNNKKGKAVPLFSVLFTTVLFSVLRWLNLTTGHHDN